MIEESAAARATTPPGYAARHWRGLLPLGVSFWRNGMLTFVAMNVFGHGFNFAYQHWIRTATLGYVILTASLALTLLLFGVRVWANIGVWRSAGQHRARGGRALWVWAARIAVGLLACDDLANVVVRTGVPAYALTQAARGEGPRMAALSLTLSADGATLSVAGDLGAGSRAQLERALRTAPHVTSVRLASHGGREYEAIEAAKLIHTRQLGTRVDDYCESACTMLFVAGRRREVGPRGSLAFHKPIVGTSFEVDYGMNDMLEGLQAVGASTALLTHLRGLRDHEVWRPTRTELTQYNLTTTPVVSLRQAQ